MILFVNDLTVIDCSYLCERRGIVGESWIVDVQLEGDLNDESMILDFGLVKKQIKRLIDEYVDHKLLIPLKSESVHVQQNNGSVLVDFDRENQQSIHLNCPNEAFAFINTQQIDITTVTDHLRETIKSKLPTNIKALTFVLRAEEINTPYYHYSHGLKKHDGNCQRIVHGHRSKIIIEMDGQRNNDLETEWSNRWQDIYLVTKEDIVDTHSLHLSEKAKQRIESGQCEQHISCAYQASQGQFELLIPRSVCEVITSDTTVECLAEFIAKQLKQNKPDSTFKVMAFEGVGKGAIAVS